MFYKVQIGNIEVEQLLSGHNSAGQNERSIEVPLGQAFAEAHANMVEIGAVLPYYSSVDHPVVDETDHAATIKQDVQGWDGLKGKSVLSISTLEHMGTGKYGGVVNKYVPKEFLQRILDEAKDYLITAPIGYNEYVDHLIKTWEDLKRIKVIYLTRDEKNQWSISDKSALALKYDKPYPWANAIAVITNWKELLTAPTSKKERTVKDILEAIDREELTVEEALLEEKDGKNRVSLIKELEKRLEEFEMSVTALDPVSQEDVEDYDQDLFDGSLYEKGLV